MKKTFGIAFLRALVLGTYLLPLNAGAQAIGTQTIVVPDSSLSPTSTYGEVLLFTGKAQRWIENLVPAPGWGTLKNDGKGEMTIVDEDFYYHWTNTSWTTPISSAGQGSIAIGSTDKCCVLSAGTHLITAKYSGDSKYAPSTSSAYTQTVNKAETVSCLTPSCLSGSSFAAFGAPVTLAARFTRGAYNSITGLATLKTYNGQMTGKVTFYDGTRTLGSAKIAKDPAYPSGFFTAELTVADLARGSHAITAVYEGDSNNLPSTGGVLTLVVDSGTSVTSWWNPETYSREVTFVATVDGGPGSKPTGTVTFMDGTTVLGTAGIIVDSFGSSAQFAASGLGNVTSYLAVGDHAITAVYSGDARNSASTSPVYTQTVLKSTTTTTIAVSAPYANALGVIVEDIVAVVTGSILFENPTGSVTFSQMSGLWPNTTATLAVVPLSAAGRATFALPTIPGVLQVTATYSGDANNLPSSNWNAVATGTYLVGAKIVCASGMRANTEATCSARSTWDDGSILPAMPSWSVNPATYATIDSSGVLRAASPGSDQTVTVTASYSSGGVTKTDSQVITIQAPTTPTATSDCLFNWAERTYPTLFAPAATSSTYAPYYYRYYSQTRAYLATSAADNHVYYLGPVSNNALLDLGALSTWLGTAGCQ